MPWRLIVDGAHDGAFNMAMDQALFEDVQAGGRPVLRLYQWRPACLSFGRNQPALGLYDTGLARALGIDIVRRPTGGQAVCHDRELTYAVAIPVGLFGRPRQTYFAINRILVRALSRIGVPALLGSNDAGEAVAATAATSAGGAPAAPLLRPPGKADRDGAGADLQVRGDDRAFMEPATRVGLVAAPCFLESAPGEVVVGGRKLVGSAQRFEKKTILQHGSILIDGDQSVVVRLQGGRGVAPASIGIREVIGREPAIDELATAITDAFSRAIDERLAPAPVPGMIERKARELTGRYSSVEWTWRR